MPKKPKTQVAKLQPKTPTTKKAAVKKSLVTKTKTKVPLRLPNVWQLTKTSFEICWKNKKPLSIIILIYGLVYLIFVLGLSSPGSNVTSIKNEFSSVFRGHLGSFYSSFSVFTYLVGSSASSSTPDGGAYQIFIGIVASLSIIWALRQFYLSVKVRARDSYYKGLYPLVPFILILLFIAVELLPLVFSIGLYSSLVSGGIAATVLEKLLSIALCLILVVFSMYLITPSIIALYIATLPDMTPVKALRSAKNIVKSRRLNIFRKIIFLPLLLFIVGVIVEIPFIIIVPFAAGWVFFILILLGLAYAHSYMYNLYRGLINE
jgi:hypothetical protein